MTTRRSLRLPPWPGQLPGNSGIHIPRRPALTPTLIIFAPRLQRPRIKAAHLGRIAAGAGLPSINNRTECQICIKELHSTRSCRQYISSLTRAHPHLIRCFAATQCHLAAAVIPRLRQRTCLRRSSWRDSVPTLMLVVPAGRGGQGSRFRASRWLGRTIVKCFLSRVATSLMFSRSATAMTEASTAPSGRSA